MKKYIIKLLVGCSSMAICSFVMAQTYEVPPSSSTYGSVPVISDAEMENCVKIYNEAKWLAQDIDTTTVDRYSQYSVDSYNQKVQKHSQMINYFNRNCAGKQSQSAYEAAQKLNKNNKY